MPESEPALHLDRRLLQPRGYLVVLYNKKRSTALRGPTANIVQIWDQVLTKLGWRDVITQLTPLWDTQRIGSLCDHFGF